MPDKVYRFRSHNPADAIKWRMALIALLRAKLGPLAGGVSSSGPKVQFAGATSSSPMASPTVKPITSKSQLNQAFIQRLSTEEERIFQFEKLIFGTTERAKYTANAFFDSLSALPIKERNNRAKEVCSLHYFSFQSQFVTCIDE
jgi:hypothetical protein